MHAAPGRVVEQALDLVGRVQMRLMRRERAVLAVALARRDSDSVKLPREGDSSQSQTAPAESLVVRSGTLRGVSEEDLHVFVEIPKGTHNKYEFDPRLGAIKARSLPLRLGDLDPTTGFSRHATATATHWNDGLRVRADLPGW